MKRRFRRPRPFRWALLILVVVLMGVRIARREDASASPESLVEGPYRVRRVIDGDTLQLENNARIRLIGADTPETVHPKRPAEAWGPEATEFTRRFVSDGLVHLRFDRERLDRYDRFLAYVWVEDRLLNEALISAGLARARLEFHYAESMKRRFRQAQSQAQRANLGIWSAEPR